MRPIKWQSTSYPRMYVGSCDLFLSTGIRGNLRYAAVPQGSSNCVRKETILYFLMSGTCLNLLCLLGITDRKL